MKNKIILLGKPQSTNNLYRRHGHIIYMTAQGKELKESYLGQAIKQWKLGTTGEELEIEIDLYFNNKLRRDIDNFFKIVLDSLTGIVWEDDSQIVKMTVTKNIDKNNPRIEIKIIL